MSQIARDYIYNRAAAELAIQTPSNIMYFDASLPRGHPMALTRPATTLQQQFYSRSVPRSLNPSQVYWVPPESPADHRPEPRYTSPEGDSVSPPPPYSPPGGPQNKPAPRAVKNAHAPPQRKLHQQFIRNCRKDVDIVKANADSKSGFLGYHTHWSERMPESVFLPPPTGPIQELTPHLFRFENGSTSLPTIRGSARRIQPTIDPGEVFALLFEDGPRMVQSLVNIRFALYHVRMRRTLIRDWFEKPYARVDPSVMLSGPWFQFVEVPAEKMHGVMKACKAKYGWEFADLRPAAFHQQRRLNETPFLEMLINTEINGEDTEWMVDPDE